METPDCLTGIVAIVEDIVNGGDFSEDVRVLLLFPLVKKRRAGFVPLP